PGQAQHRVPALGGQLRVLEVAGGGGELDGAREVREAAGGVHAAHHGEGPLVAVQPGQERHPGLVVEGGGGEHVAAQRLGGIEDAAGLLRVPCVQRLHGGGGRGGGRGEGAQQRVGVLTLHLRRAGLGGRGPVAHDEVGEVEVIPGEHAQTLL